MRIRLLAALAFLAAGIVHGQTLYVSDELIITMRTGPSTQNAIVRNLPAGTRVEVLDDSPAAGYVRVRALDRGTEGWVLMQYLVAEPIARDRLASAQQRLSQANARVGELEQKVAAVGSELEETQQQLARAQQAGSKAASELEDIKKTSANAVALKEQNESLRRRVSELDLERERLATENAGLESRAQREWFVIGAAVLLAGIIVGLVLPTLRRKRRSSW
jgi:SH3 domain protein